MCFFNQMYTNKGKTQIRKKTVLVKKKKKKEIRFASHSPYLKSLDNE